MTNEMFMWRTAAVLLILGSMIVAAVAITQADQRDKAR